MTSLLDMTLALGMTGGVREELSGDDFQDEYWLFLYVFGA